MNVDDADNLRRFVAQIQGQADRWDPNTVTSSPTPQPNLSAKGAVGSELADEHDASSEAQPKPSPHSGLRAPFNSPKTAASSPRLAAANTHNEDVSDAISEYIKELNGSPLSESMWAPRSARYKPSTLSGARSANVLTPSKAVKPNPATNETFDRMSFRAADNVQSDQVQPVRVSEGGLADPAPDEGVGKENTAPSTPKSKLAPHLLATRVSSQESIKAEGKVPSSEGLGPDATSTIGSIKSTQATKAMVSTGPEGKEDLEHKAVFSAWPALEERRRPAAEVRTVVIKDLPRDSAATFVTSIVYGGPIEEIQIRPSAAGNVCAAVRFMNAKDCQRFYEETANGLVYKKDAKGRALVLFVELAKDVDVVGGLLQGWIDTGITRCVRAVGVESKWDLDGLRKIAERKNRKVEKIIDGQNAGGARSVVFRFCRVEDAVRFKAALSRDEDWEQCNIHYAGDPCATASGVHLED